jgi:hypothetical protein
MAAKKEDLKITKCYTYEVKMLVQVIAENELEANEKLDSQGGYVTKRETTLKDTISLYSGINKEK